VPGDPEKNPTVPIISSAPSREIDKILGLELGADDFIVKPFGVKEVIARIRAITRRCLASRAPAPSRTFTMHDLTILPEDFAPAWPRRDRFKPPRHQDSIAAPCAQGKAVDRNTFFNDCWAWSTSRTAARSTSISPNFANV